MKLAEGPAGGERERVHELQAAAAMAGEAREGRKEGFK
jgi:hypothetical protein